MNAPAVTTLGAAFTAVARAHPHRTALVQGDLRIGYGELAARAAAAAGRLADIEPLLAPDFEWVYHGPAALPWAGVYRGVEGFRNFFAIVRELIQVQECDAYDYLDAGDRVVVLGVSRTRVLANDAHYEAQWMNVFTVRDGLISRYLDLYDTASVVDALRRDRREVTAAS